MTPLPAAAQGITETKPTLCSVQKANAWSPAPNEIIAVQTPSFEGLSHSDGRLERDVFTESPAEPLLTLFNELDLRGQKVLRVYLFYFSFFLVPEEHPWMQKADNPLERGSLSMVGM